MPMKKFLICFLVTAVAVAFMPTGATVWADESAASKVSGPITSEYTNDDGDSDLITTWDCVWFGSYPQSDSEGSEKEPIKWRVLSVSGNDAFVLADKILDCKKYNDTYDGNCTWETCSLRGWLNDDFYNAAFSSAEQNSIRTTKVETEGDIVTSDNVYLLSYTEATNTAYGFPEDGCVESKTRRSGSTAYAKAQGFDGFHCSMDWLRYPGGYCGVEFYSGAIAGQQWDDSIYDEYSNGAVRPAMHIDLSSSDVSYAGTVSSEDETRASQTITAASKTKTYGAASFGLGAKTSGDGKLTYKSGNTSVATVNSSGKITIKGVGTAKITIRAPETINYTAASKTVTITVNKAANPLSIKAGSGTVKYSKVKKSAQKLAVTKVITFVKKGQGTMTYTKVSGNSKITINKSTGKVTVKKGLKKATYKVKVKVKAAGNANYKASAVKSVTFKIKVK